MLAFTGKTIPGLLCWISRTHPRYGLFASTFCPTHGFSIKPQQLELFAEKKAGELRPLWFQETEPRGHHGLRRRHDLRGAHGAPLRSAPPLPAPRRGSRSRGGGSDPVLPWCSKGNQKRNRLPGFKRNLWFLLAWGFTGLPKFPFLVIVDITFLAVQGEI